MAGVFQPHPIGARWMAPHSGDELAQSGIPTDAVHTELSLTADAVDHPVVLLNRFEEN